MKYTSAATRRAPIAHSPRARCSEHNTALHVPEDCPCAERTVRCSRQVVCCCSRHHPKVSGWKQKCVSVSSPNSSVSRLGSAGWRFLRVTAPPVCSQMVAGAGVKRPRLLGSLSLPSFSFLTQSGADHTNYLMGSLSNQASRSTSDSIG